jgi:hypothetical protein
MIAQPTLNKGKVIVVSTCESKLNVFILLATTFSVDESDVLKTHESN